MQQKTVVGLVFALLFLCSQSSYSQGHLRDDASGGPGIPFPWQTSAKQGVGTAYEAYDANHGYSSSSPTAPISKVWFTIARGIVTEVYYPRIDTAQSRDTQLLISDGKSFLHQEQFDTEHEVSREPLAPLYHIVNRDRQGRYAIHKDIWADPDSDTVIQKIRIERKVPGLSFYLLHKPTAANTIFGDQAESKPFIAGEERGAFTGWQGLAASVPFEKTSVGYVGTTDGFQDLVTDFQMTYEFRHAFSGNVAMMGKLAIPADVGTSDLTVFLFFGPTRDAIVARHATIGSLDVDASRREFLRGWQGYLGGLDMPAGLSAKRRGLWQTSMLVLKSAEDKTYAGAVVASPSLPWGDNVYEYPGGQGGQAGYHSVWPRDLYHIGNAFLAAGDRDTAIAVGYRYRALQFGPKEGEWRFGSRVRSKEGSFPQNVWVDGSLLQGGYQADETAMPVLFAHRLWKRGLVPLDDVWAMVRSAALFLADMGVWTQQERWEEHYGVSPNSAATVIAAVAVASEMAFARGEVTLGDRLQKLADGWATVSGKDIDAMTFTRKGTIGSRQYYLRLSGAQVDVNNNGAPLYDAPADPDLDVMTLLPNNIGNLRFRHQTDVVDGGFLELVRVGIRAATHPNIRATIGVIDPLLKRDTANGPGWYRYRWDGYGEENRGRLWPLLTGERIHYELQNLLEQGVTNPAPQLEAQVAAYEGFASDDGLFAEQVWDEGDRAGRPTGGAMPLCWAHAEYVELLRSLADKAVYENVAQVHDRYAR